MQVEYPLSHYVAIEITSKNVTLYEEDNPEIDKEDEGHKKGLPKTIKFNDPITFREPRQNPFHHDSGRQLYNPKDLEISERPAITYWTVGIPDIASQERRQAVIDMVGKIRKEPKIPEKADSESYPKLQYPPVRLINRTTAGAIAYLHGIRSQERAVHNANGAEGDIEAYMPERSFKVVFVDNYEVYGAAFKTTNGVVEPIKSYTFQTGSFNSEIKEYLKNIEEIEGTENPPEDKETSKLQNIAKLWNVIAFHKVPLKTDTIATDSTPETPIVFTIDLDSYLIEKNVVKPIPDSMYNSAPDKFALLPSLNASARDWEVPGRFILKGINIKARMLAGDPDLIDYDVPSGFVGNAQIEFQNFTATLIKDGDKLPIKRTVFEATKEVEFEVNYGFYGKEKKVFQDSLPQSFVCEVDENGIIQNFKSTSFGSLNNNRNDGSSSKSSPKTVIEEKFNDIEEVIGC